ncbi:unnamed protein product, partial [Dicrocoelium dendriticum]
MFRYSIGSEASRIMEAWDLWDNEPYLLEIIERFERYCVGRSYFFTHSRRADEDRSFDPESDQQSQEQLPNHLENQEDQHCISAIPQIQGLPIPSRLELRATVSRSPGNQYSGMQCSVKQSCHERRNDFTVHPKGNAAVHFLKKATNKLIEFKVTHEDPYLMQLRRNTRSTAFGSSLVQLQFSHRIDRKLVRSGRGYGNCNTRNMKRKKKERMWWWLKAWANRFACLSAVDKAIDRVGA